MGCHLRRTTTFLVACAVVSCTPQPNGAQTDLPPSRLVTVQGRAVHVRTAGLEQRTAGRPVLVLEAGGGATLDAWDRAFAQLAELAPVVAYDRRGLGKSEYDGVKPTVRRVAQSLHELLAALHVSPPYILVGHSWGGVIVRGFAEAHPAEVAGIVYVETPDFDATDEEKAAVFPPEERHRAFAAPDVPSVPPDTPAGQRAEMEVLVENFMSDFAEAKAIKPPAGLPVAVLVASPANRARGLSGLLLRLQIKHQSEWALTAPGGLFIAANHVGHQAHRDDPALVARAVKHVYDQATAARK